MIKAALHHLLGVVLLASPAFCCCTVVTAGGQTEQRKCCCRQPESQRPAAPSPAPQKTCSCKQKQPYVPITTSAAPTASNLVVDLLPAVDAWLHTNSGDESLGPRADFTQIPRICLTAQERLRALPILRL